MDTQRLQPLKFLFSKNKNIRKGGKWWEYLKPPWVGFLCYNRDMEGLKIILAYVLGWFVAQTTKYILLCIKGVTKGKSGKEKARLYAKSGGMPSGHAGSIIGATMYSGLAFGFGSIPFGILACFSATVIYDAVNVRYAVGEQGKKMNKLIKTVKPDDELVKIVEGHTGVEVFVGALIGALMGSLVFLVLK